MLNARANENNYAPGRATNTLSFPRASLLFFAPTIMPQLRLAQVMPLAEVVPAGEGGTATVGVPILVGPSQPVEGTVVVQQE